MNGIHFGMAFFSIGIVLWTGWGMFRDSQRHKKRMAELDEEIVRAAAWRENLEQTHREQRLRMAMAGTVGGAVPVDQFNVRNRINGREFIEVAVFDERERASVLNADALIEPPPQLRRQRILNYPALREAVMRKDFSRYTMQEYGYQLLDESKYGKLWHMGVFVQAHLRILSRTHAEEGMIVTRQRLVEVVDPSTQQKYFLAVPSTTKKTAKAAVAWTFGMTESQYNPQLET
jgi:hypothetical protein